MARRANGWIASRAHRGSLATVLGLNIARAAGPGRVLLWSALVFVSLVLVGGLANAFFARLGIQPLRGITAESLPESMGLLFLAISAGFVEEFVFRGYLQEQLLAFTGSAVLATVLQIAIFTSGHSYQGFARIPSVFLIACILTASARLTKSLVPGMVAHGVGDSLIVLPYLVHALRS